MYTLRLTRATWPLISLFLISSPACLMHSKMCKVPQSANISSLFLRSENFDQAFYKVILIINYYAQVIRKELGKTSL
jgi:hypothetical protein